MLVLVAGVMSAKSCGLRATLTFEQLGQDNVGY